ncbi:ABC-F family ATP-binding cassette domain-containing protein [Vibrio sp. RE86]|uniref:ABC-F family ATP-binding cassette domain-containing protein n=1 Tax=Vibrio sp. RE86 TaxID=2607605 RepID=UPI001493CB5A|nr:ATP-binding cassette domain-containing protein [Vibrio sp. RE86]NOH78627.1 ABC-F family ATP-binding cassette domain-containing protein [Vibrio sp. RE86]
MPVLQTHNISHQFENGDTLFTQLSCSMTKQRVGLVGRNGAGKSVLASILSGEVSPSSGAVTLPRSFSMYRQQASHSFSQPCTVAQFLGKSEVLDAIKQVEQGDCAEHWFNIIAEQWDLPTKLADQLAKLGLPPEPEFSCLDLSGGQLAVLQLWRLFESDVELLILDEPSNHLDNQARQWLIDSMRSYEGAILLISHDRTLLREMEEIWELSTLGLQVFGGNYDDYAKHKSTELQAVERQLTSVEKQKKQLELQAQHNREKAEQRAAKGNKLRKDGSQPKILLDGKKNKAELRSSNRHKNEQLRRGHLQDKQQALHARKEQLQTQKIYLAEGQTRSRKVITLIDAVLPFGHQVPIDLQVYANEKIHLVGKNGSGKSTLLKALLGELSFRQGEVLVNTPLYYLDQHFGVINSELSLLENLMQNCSDVKESDARTLLAGIGFRRDDVFPLGEVLSGGEKMKLAMLIVSHQPNQPLLLLDEPDNHLDLDSKSLLAQALNEYRGGFILISHDDDFVSESGVTRSAGFS